jgi:hypothetical protein
MEFKEPSLVLANHLFHGLSGLHATPKKTGSRVEPPHGLATLLREDPGVRDDKVIT